ncbi:hypothetical protein [Nocardia sp. NPDC050406]|uniref:hypothetical protein n=1 Tax=Nocardia sp. NPDC050406 TaxID=3364318 RepID=UPI0037B299DF
MYWEVWQQSWDRQQELYMPDREERFRVMWHDIAADPVLADEYAASRAIFDARTPGVPQPLTWHLDRLAEAGFTESGTAWRSITDAVVVAIR